MRKLQELLLSQRGESELLGAATAGQKPHCKNTRAEAQTSVSGPPVGILHLAADVAEFQVSCECKPLRAETNKVSLWVGFVRIRAEAGELKGLRDFWSADSRGRRQQGGKV